MVASHVSLLLKRRQNAAIAGEIQQLHVEITDHQINSPVVAVKQLDRNGLQGLREFLVVVLMPSVLHHQNLVNLIGYCADGDQRLLAQPYFKDPKRFPELADPSLQGDFPAKGLNQAVAIAVMCLQEEASVRPLITDVVIALSFLSDN
ncbi:hypothetical protein AAC387_Pa05g0413 [Persea americana]